MVEANQRLTGTVVVAPLHLQVIKTLGLEGSGHHWKGQRLNGNTLSAQVVRGEDPMVKPLGVQPLGERAGGGQFRNGAGGGLGHGCSVWVCLAGARLSGETASAAARACCCVCARR